MSKSTREQRNSDMASGMRHILSAYQKRKYDYENSDKPKHHSRNTELAYNITKHFFDMDKAEFEGEGGAKKAANFQSLVYMLAHRMYDKTKSNFETARDKGWRYFLSLFRKQKPWQGPSPETKALNTSATSPTTSPASSEKK